MAHFLTATILLAVVLLTAETAAGRLTKRQIGFVGGFSPAKVDDAEVVKMADFATTSVSASMNSGPVKLVKIVKAETQVVSGTNYKLNLELSGANSQVIPCEVVVFNQPWTNTRKMIRSSCTPKRTTRQIGAFPISGGYSPRDVDDVDVKEISSFATSAIAANTNSGPVSLIKVVKAESQVVAGTNYKLTMELNGAEGAILCDVVVFDQSWTNTRRLTESKCFPAKNALVKVAEAVQDDTQVKTKKTTRQIGSFPIAGGFSPLDVNDVEVKEMAAFATSAIAANTNSGPVYLTKVVRAESQVVAGRNFKLTLELNGAEGTILCNVVVFDQSWTNTRRLSKSECFPAKNAVA